MGHLVQVQVHHLNPVDFVAFEDNTIFRLIQCLPSMRSKIKQVAQPSSTQNGADHPKSADYILGDIEPRVPIGRVNSGGVDCLKYIFFFKLTKHKIQNWNFSKGW